MNYTATYCPDDNKLRLSASSRLDKDLYLRVKAAGFGWAPKQGIFVAPMWTPEREDLCIELAGEVDDEDTSLVERSEDRAERFEGYSDNRLRDAESAKRAVDRIADGIPFGQPILVGHHSEKHARRDAAKIENGMRKSIKMWETSKYWESRAAGAIRAAKYKELPAVRARRIKGLEADIRRCKAAYTPQEPKQVITQTPWDVSGDDCKEPHVWCGQGRSGNWVRVARLEAIEASYARWIQHYENRLTYERAMLAEGGGLAADAFDLEVGGQVLRRGQWMIITKVNRKDGAIISVSVIGHWASTVPIEDVQEYRAPREGDGAKVKAITKLSPLVNYRAEGCAEMTIAEWKQKTKYSDSYQTTHFDAEGKHTWGRVKQGEKPIAYRQRSKVSIGSGYNHIPVFITDSKVIEPPKQAPLPSEPVTFERHEKPERPMYRAPERTEFDDMKDSLKAGIQVVSAPQLFPTPHALAARMVEMARVRPGMEVLEPSAGTGRLAEAIRAVGGKPFMVEIDHRMCEMLSTRFTPKGESACLNVLQGDFLTMTGIGLYDRIVMNPPFADSQDIAHVEQAYSCLKPRGILVSVMGAGAFFRSDRRATEFRQWLDELNSSGASVMVEDLPANTFESSGTGVSTKLVKIERRAA